jgi:hypothetical protein
MLKSKDKFERAEGYIILFLLASSFMLSIGIGLSAISSRGLPAFMAMLGALLSFLSVVALIILWVWKEMVKE